MGDALRWSELDRHKLRVMLESLYRKEREQMKHEDQRSEVLTSAKMDTNSDQAEPGIVLRRSAVNVAVRLAEQSVDEIQARIRDAEQERDRLARSLGAQQDLLDRLTSEREFRTRHVRDLQAVRDA